MTSLMFDKWYIINDYKDIHEEEDDDGDENFSCLGVTRVHLPFCAIAHRLHQYQPSVSN